MATITAANSEFVIVCPQVFAVPQTLQGYATDDAFDTEEVTLAETKLGVDAFKSAGFIPYLITQAIHLQADSTAIAVFDAIAQAMTSSREVVELTGSIWLPGPGTVYDMANGTLTKYKPLPDVKKLLEPQNFSIVWQSATKSNTVGF